MENIKFENIKTQEDLDKVIAEVREKTKLNFNEVLDKKTAKIKELETGIKELNTNFEKINKEKSDLSEKFNDVSNKLTSTETNLYSTKVKYQLKKFNIKKEHINDFVEKEKLVDLYAKGDKDAFKKTVSELLNKEEYGQIVFNPKKPADIPYDEIEDPSKTQIKDTRKTYQ